MGATTVVNRVDIDFSCKKAERCSIFSQNLESRPHFLSVCMPPNTTLFLSRIIVSSSQFVIKDIGGYHSEVVDQATIWNESAEVC